MTDIATAERQQCELIDELNDLEGTNLGIVTLGGWVIGGQLGEVDDCVSVISTGTTIFDTLIVPGSITIIGPTLLTGAIFIPGSFRVWSNLKTLTQILRT